MVAHNPIDEFFRDTPIITRSWVILTHFDFISPIDLFYNPRFYRVFTNFLYYGPFGLDFIFHLFFMTRYSKLLEEGSFRNKRADFVYFLLLAVTALLIIGPYFQLLFLGQPLTFALLYVWAKRNPFIPMAFLGFIHFQAPMLPWVLLAFSFILSGTLPISDLLGIAIGHAYYFLVDIYPQTSGRRILATPQILKVIFNEIDLPQVIVEPNLTDDLVDLVDWHDAHEEIPDIDPDDHRYEINDNIDHEHQQ